MDERHAKSRRRCGPRRLSAERLDAVILDLDGVVTDTADAHAAAWQRLFDAYLEERAAEDGDGYRPYRPEQDYREHLDGKPRYDGVRDFLESRGIDLPWGDPEDPPDRETVCGLGNRKNALFREWLEHHKVRTFPDAVEAVRVLQSAGVRAAVISASRNCAQVLENAGLTDLFDTKVDGVDAARLELPGKPDPAIFLCAARRLGVRPERAAVVEDALAGVEAGAAGGFGFVVGVARGAEAGGEKAQALRERGADVVVDDLLSLLDRRGEAASQRIDRLPSAWQAEDELKEAASDRKLAVFLDYDGTLTPIVDDPAQARLGQAMRDAIAALAVRCRVAVISGRDIDDLRDRVGLPELFYAGSHGFEIAGPEGWHEVLEKGAAFLPDLDAAERTLRAALERIDGAAVERKKFSIAAHYRRVAEPEVGAVEDAVDEALDRHPRLRKSRGKKVLQIQPATDWDKGRAMDWLLERLGLDGDGALPLYIGDDVTDEDAFRALARRGTGIGIVVREGGRRATDADYALDGTDDVRRFLERLVQLQQKART